MNKLSSHLSVALASMLLGLVASGTAFADPLKELFEDSKVLLNSRLRFESADVDGFEDSEAFTLRTRLGLQTGEFEGFSALVEVEYTTSLNGEENYDAYPGSQGTAGKSAIFDPKTAEIDQFYIMYKSDNYSAKIGRQRIILDNARFIGNVGWRQNEQTFDAVLISGGPSENVNLTYAYIDEVRRIFGSEAIAAGQKFYDSSSHILNARFNSASGHTFTGYAYLVELDQAAAASSQTLGGYFAGPLNNSEDFKLSYRAELAIQSDYGKNPSSFNTDYYHASLTGAFETFSWTAAFESLGSDNGVGFSTPLATLHAFNGFADTYLSTPNGGLDDFYLSGSAGIPGGAKAAIFYHMYDGTHNGSDAGGSEIDLVLSKKFSDMLSGVAKYASYNGDGVFADRDKIWLQLDFNY